MAEEFDDGGPAFPISGVTERLGGMTWLDHAAIQIAARSLEDIGKYINMAMREAPPEHHEELSSEVIGKTNWAEATYARAQYLLAEKRRLEK